MSTPHSHIELFEWNPGLETGIPDIDRQNRQLVMLFNQLCHSLAHRDRSQSAICLDRLAEHIDMHCRIEESIWDSYFHSDPWLNKHKNSHHELFSFIEAIRPAIQAPYPALREDVIHFFLMWLTHHINYDDKRLATALNNLNAGLSLGEAKEHANQYLIETALALTDTVVKMFESLSVKALQLLHEHRNQTQIQQELKQVNQKLNSLAITDQLTGLFNRHHFEEVFRRELGRAHRENRHLSYLMLDVDNFKQINDRYGHLQGDTALKTVAQTLQAFCQRPGDFLFRIGGEEFGVLLTDQSSSHGLRFAESIRAGIEHMTIQLDSHCCGLTVSIGVVSMIPAETNTVDDFLRKADQHLYRAKDLGRNTVIASI